MPCSGSWPSIGSIGQHLLVHRRYPRLVAQSRTFLLMGSGEFEPWSSEIERAALDGRGGPVAVLPTASSTEGDTVFDRWGRMGLDHYASMAVEARVLPVKTREDAEDEANARALDDAAMIFFSGGKPQHLASTIEGTKLWTALHVALDRGAVYAGCSAGALIASQSRDQRRERGTKTGWVFGLGLVPHLSFGVHWDKVKVIPGLRSFVMARIPKGSWFVGLDERTAILGDGLEWRVYGVGEVMVRHAGGTTLHRAGGAFRTSDPPDGSVAILVCRGLDRGPGDGTHRGGAPAEVFPVRTRDVRPGQEGTAVGARDLGRPPGPGVPLLPGGAAGLGGAARSVRELRGHAADRDARPGRLPGLRPRPRRGGRTRVDDGRLAQR